MTPHLTTDDLFALIGAKEAQMALMARQHAEVVADLRATIAALEAQRLPATPPPEPAR